MCNHSVYYMYMFMYAHTIHKLTRAHTTTATRQHICTKQDGFHGGGGGGDYVGGGDVVDV